MDRLRNWWFSRQGLGGTVADAPGATTQGCGWLRSVGSANPYLAIHARSGASRAEIERAVADVELVELVAARGCTYHVPRQDAAVALRLASVGNCQAEFKMAEKHLGVTDAEVSELADAIVRALENGPLDPRAISAGVKEVRHMGDEGKKRGMTTTLGLGLSRLQLQGRIRRLPQDGRLDTERYRYALWENGPQPSLLSDGEMAAQVTRLYIGWAGPATEKEFREFTGLSAKLAKVAMVGLAPCPDDPTRFMLPDDLPAYEATKGTEGRVVLLSSIDPWLHSRRNLPTLLDPAESERTVPYGAALAGANALRDLDSHPIVQDGVVVGMWEFDHERQEIVHWAWRPSREVEAAVRETGEWIAKELGDFRSFSLDSPKSRIPRVELLRSLS
ncbi:hypothetical protein EON82_18035 [bacterium]|nr:MAG: hypothetical protein EON82_18035 [bacterium]